MSVVCQVSREQRGSGHERNVGGMQRRWRCAAALYESDNTHTHAHTHARTHTRRASPSSAGIGTHPRSADELIKGHLAHARHLVKVIGMTPHGEEPGVGILARDYEQHLVEETSMVCHLLQRQSTHVLPAPKLVPLLSIHQILAVLVETHERCVQAQMIDRQIRVQ